MAYGELPRFDWLGCVRCKHNENHGFVYAIDYDKHGCTILRVVQDISSVAQKGHYQILTWYPDDCSIVRKVIKPLKELRELVSTPGE